MWSSRIEQSRKDLIAYNEGVVEGLLRLFAPLRLLGLDWCAYGKHFLDEEQNSQKMFFLQTHLEAQRWVCDCAISNGDLFIQAIRETPLGQFNYFITPPSSDDVILNAYRERFSLHTGITLFFRHKKYIEGWNFMSTQPRSILSQRSLDRSLIEIFDRFIKAASSEYSSLGFDESQGMLFHQKLDYRPSAVWNPDLFCVL